jgi:uncharacterized membrane protein (UPF0182 family)
MGPSHRWLLVGGTTYFACHIGLAASQQWKLWLLFQHGGDIGQSAPVAGGDIGLHLFRLPFLGATSSYFRQLCLFTVVVARPSIATNRVGTFDGPRYTERYLTKPGLLLVALSAVGFAAVWRARTVQRRPFLVTLGAATFVHLAGLVVLPLATDRFVVAPAAAERQLWSTEDDLDATSAAYGLDRVDFEPLVLASFADVNAGVNAGVNDDVKVAGERR